MKITELFLKSFGKFYEKKIELADGINLIYGENESGKSTVYTFLRGMLFGMERGRGRAALKDNFSKYEPWSNPNSYSGTLRFTCEGKHFCLNRNFDKYAKNASLFCEDDGEEFSLEHGDLKILLGGLRELDYDNTVGVGQSKVLVGNGLAEELKNYAANYYISGDSQIDMHAALQALKERKKQLEREIREQAEKAQEQKERTEQEASYVWRDLRSLEQETAQVKEEQEKYNREFSKINMENPERFEQWRIHPVAALVMIGIVVLTMLVFDRPWNLVTSIVIILAEGIYVWNALKDGRKKKDNEKKKKEVQKVWNEINKCEGRLEKLKEDYQEKQVYYENLQEQIEECEESGKETLEQKKKRKALELAVERIQEIAGEMQAGVGRKLNEEVSELFAEMTDGKYQKVWIDEALEMSLLAGNRKVSMNQVSLGTLEQLQLALRIATANIMYEEKYPLILDDTFAYYDDRRLERMLGWLERSGHQVLIFTCQKREEALMKKNGIPFHKVELGVESGH